MAVSVSVTVGTETCAPGVVSMPANAGSSRIRPDLLSRSVQLQELSKRITFQMVGSVSSAGSADRLAGPAPVSDPVEPGSRCAQKARGRGGPCVPIETIIIAPDSSAGDVDGMRVTEGYSSNDRTRNGIAIHVASTASVCRWKGGVRVSNASASGARTMSDRAAWLRTEGPGAAWHVSCAGTSGRLRRPYQAWPISVRRNHPIRPRLHRCSAGRVRRHGRGKTGRRPTRLGWALSHSLSFRSSRPLYFLLPPFNSTRLRPG